MHWYRCFCMSRLLLHTREESCVGIQDAVRDHQSAVFDIHYPCDTPNAHLIPKYHFVNAVSCLHYRLDQYGPVSFPLGTRVRHDAFTDDPHK